MVTHRGLSRGAAFAVLIAGASACQEVTPPPPGGDVNLVVTASLAGTAATTVVVEVTAADILPPLVFNLPVVGNIASGPVIVSAGSDRAFTIRAYDAKGILTHTGSHTMDVVSAGPPTITITLVPLSGDVGIDATIGAYSVTVTPAVPPTLAVAGTVDLDATIMLNGVPQTGTVRWATQAPGVATVNTDGLVTGVGAGTTNIVATFGGAAGAVSVTVN